MKNKIIITVSFILFLFVNCSDSNQSKAEKTVEEYLKNNLNDWKSYESMSYSVIIPFKVSYFEDPFYINNSKISSSYNKKLREEIEKNDKLNRQNKGKDDEYSLKRIEHLKLMYDTANYYMNINDSIEKNFIPYEKGYVIKHKYRAANSFGSTIINEDTFWLDDDLKNVIARKGKESPIFIFE